MTTIDWAHIQTRPTRKDIILGAVDAAIQGLSFIALLVLIFGFYMMVG